MAGNAKGPNLTSILNDAVDPDDMGQDLSELEIEAQVTQSRRAEQLGLGPDAPVLPLGRDGDGKGFYYLNSINVVVRYNETDHGHNQFVSMCGDDEWLIENYPQKKEVVVRDAEGNKIGTDWLITGFNSGDVRTSLMRACTRAGIWDASEKMRGRGAWRDDANGMILHLGDRLIHARPVGTGKPAHLSTLPAGPLGDHIYPRGYALPEPSKAAVAAEGGDECSDGPISEIIQLFQTWNWERPEVDPHLAFAWVCSAMVCGALEVRPIIWLTGDRGTGKSTLQDVMQALIGPGLIKTKDTTAAGLYQRLGQSALPIMVDEAERGENSARMKALLRLARTAYDGDLMLRGGQDHKGVEFQCRSSFLFAAIRIPDMTDAELSRSAILSLNRLTDRVPFTLDEDAVKAAGRMMLRRIIDQWPRFSQTLDAYAVALMDAGHDARGADQLGTMLAARHLVLFDHLPDEEDLEIWKDRLAAREWKQNLDQATDAERCLDHLLNSRPDAYSGGSRRTVAELVRVWCKDESTDNERREANELLMVGGMKMQPVKDHPFPFLAVQKRHPMLSRMFEGTDWEARQGYTGGYVASLSRFKEDGGITDHNVRFQGRSPKCVMIPTPVLFGTEDGKPLRDQHDAD